MFIYTRFKKPIIVKKIEETDSYIVLKKELLDVKRVLIEKTEYLFDLDKRYLIKFDMFKYLKLLNQYKINEEKEYFLGLENILNNTEIPKFFYEDLNYDFNLEAKKCLKTFIDNSVKNIHILVKNENYKLTRYAFSNDLNEFIEEVYQNLLDFKYDIEVTNFIFDTPIIQKYDAPKTSNEVIFIQSIIDKLEYFKLELFDYVNEKSFIKDYVLERFDSSIENKNDFIKAMNTEIQNLINLYLKYLVDKFKYLEQKDIIEGKMYISYDFNLIPICVIPILNSKGEIDLYDLNGLKETSRTTYNLFNYNDNLFQEIKEYYNYNSIKEYIGNINN